MNEAPKELDKNMIDKTPDEEGLIWYPVSLAEFGLTGHYSYDAEEGFLRLPKEIAEAANDGVANNNHHTAGVRARFSTDANRLAVRVRLPYVKRFGHMALSGTTGFDLYLDSDDGNSSRFLKLLKPLSTITDGYTLEVDLPEGMHFYTLHFPLYNPVTHVEIGLPEGAKLEKGHEYRPILPVVYYGSSITQGACSSRPGLAYENRISAHLNVNHLNLGFSGHALAEPVIMNYMAKLPMSVFVYDYDHNAPNPDYLEQTHEPGFQIIREANPDLPIVLTSRPDAYTNPENARKRLATVQKTYENALANGDKNVRFINGFDFFAGPNAYDCTTDGTHPNDLGFTLMTEKIEPVIQDILGL